VDHARGTLRLQSISNSLNVRILFVQHASDQSGSTISGELTARGFRHAGWHVEAALGSAGPAVEWFSRAGCETIVVPHKNWLRGGDALRSIRRIASEIGSSQAFVRLIKERRPDLVYINSIVSLAGAIAARRMCVPCVWHIRELLDDVDGEMRIPPCGGKSLIRRVVNACAAHTVLISEAVRSNILGNDCTTPFSVVPNAVDERFFKLTLSAAECRARFGLPADGLIVGVPGTLRPMKGHEFFLEGAAQAIANGARCLFAVTGDGESEYVAHLHQVADRLGLKPHVRFLGTVNRMEEFYRACDIVCIPSRAEPFGRTVVEAFAVGPPVLASAVGGILETIRNGENGLLVEYGDARALALSLASLIGDRSMREALSQVARQDAHERYTAGAYQKRINDIVRRTLQQQAKRSNSLAEQVQNN
jgi:glycosyltransferase involved in cell wall biosynthesis